MERVEHLIDGFRCMIFDSHAGAKSPTVRGRIENNHGGVALRGALIQGRQNLAHHRDVENVKRRPREGNSRDPIVSAELYAFEFPGHADALLFGSSTGNRDLRLAQQPPSQRGIGFAQRAGELHLQN